MNRNDELRHLQAGAEVNEQPSGLGTVCFKVLCANNSTDVLQKAKSVLQAVVQMDCDDWDSIDAWRTLLPRWFIDCCAPTMTKEQTEQWLEQWRRLSPEEQRQAESEQCWALEDWLYWLQPAQRTWFWWGALIDDSDTLHVVVEVEDWPFAWDSLSWLLRASGALNVESES
jgi:hypothetical protein